ncbi:MAG: hypothetical protein ACRD6N_20615 [Pyrinomonadaceae bacterium]
MKAIVYHKSGSADVLKLEEIEKPVPEDDEVLYPPITQIMPS